MDRKEDKAFQRLYDLAFAKRPKEELYDLSRDPEQLINVAGKAEYLETLQQLGATLQRHLKDTSDPRALGHDAPWDYYPYYGIRRNPDWKVEPRP